MGKPVPSSILRTPVLSRMFLATVLAATIVTPVIASSQIFEYNNEIESVRPSKEFITEASGEQAFSSITADMINDHLYALGSNGTDSTLSKYDENGTLLWSKKYALGSEGRVVSILYAKGTIYSIGFTGNVTDQQSILTMHDESGNLLKTSPINAFRVNALDFENDSLFLTGTNQSSVLVQNYDLDGNLVWSKTWESGTGYSVDAYIASVYVTGVVQPGSSEDERTFVLKYALDGELQWERTLNDTYPNNGYDIIAYGGKVYVTGYSTEKLPDPLMLAAYDFEGNLLWRKSWNVIWGHSDGEEFVVGGIGYGMALDERHLYVTGELTRAGDVLLQKYDLDGNLVWTTTWDCCDHKFLPGTHNNTGFDAGRDIVISNSYAYVAGVTFASQSLVEDSLLLKYKLSDSEADGTGPVDRSGANLGSYVGVGIAVAAGAIAGAIVLARKKSARAIKDQ